MPEDTLPLGLLTILIFLPALGALGLMAVPREKEETVKRFAFGIWGGPRRVYATLKFVLYTMAGSLLMLVAIIALYFQSGPAGARTFDLEAIQTYLVAHPIDAPIQMWMFLAFALAFAIKVPMFP